MDQSLRISVTLVNNRFNGQGWPASPSRLFSALLAGTMTGGYRRNWSAVEPALRWLERQTAPEIAAYRAQEEPSYRISVPNNDMDVAAREWRKGGVFDASSLRTMKRVAPVRLGETVIHAIYTWRCARIEPDTFEGLRLAVHSLHTLGWGVDAAFADVRAGGEQSSLPEGFEVWLPSKSRGKALSVPVEGSLDDLRTTYGRFLNAVTALGVDADTRPAVYRLQSYSKTAPKRETAVFELRVPDGSDVMVVPAHRGMEVAAWMRHAAAEALREEGVDEDTINSVALGHSDDFGDSGRLSYVPLPSIGHPYSDGMIRRVMIVDGSGNLIDLLKRKLRSWRVTDQHGSGACSLSIPTNDRVVPFYVNTSREWRSVTPVVLHGHNATRGEISQNKTTKLLLQALKQGGIEAREIDDMFFQTAPFWARTGSARSARVPNHLDRWPRYHVGLRVREPMAGPVLAGIGRHYGFGLFAGKP